MKPEHYRMFTAIKPDANLLGELVKKAGSMKHEAWSQDFRWISEENYHVTVVFLGDHPAENVELMAESFQRACSLIEPVEITLSGMLVMPSPSKPRIIAAGLSESSGLSLIVDAIKQAAESFGVPPEKRPFKGHITLGRIKKNRKVRRLEIEEELRPVSMNVDRIHLLKSVLKPGGAEYSSLGEVVLQGK